MIVEHSPQSTGSLVTGPPLVISIQRAPTRLEDENVPTISADSPLLDFAVSSSVSRSPSRSPSRCTSLPPDTPNNARPIDLESVGGEAAAAALEDLSVSAASGISVDRMESLMFAGATRRHADRVMDQFVASTVNSLIGGTQRRPHSSSVPPVAEEGGSSAVTRAIISQGGRGSTGANTGSNMAMDALLARAPTSPHSPVHRSIFLSMGGICGDSLDLRLTAPRTREVELQILKMKEQEAASQHPAEHVLHQTPHLRTHSAILAGVHAPVQAHLSITAAPPRVEGGRPHSPSISSRPPSRSPSRGQSSRDLSPEKYPLGDGPITTNHHHAHNLNLKLASWELFSDDPIADLEPAKSSYTADNGHLSPKGDFAVSTHSFQKYDFIDVPETQVPSYLSRSLRKPTVSLVMNKFAVISTTTGKYGSDGSTPERDVKSNEDKCLEKWMDHIDRILELEEDGDHVVRGSNLDVSPGGTINGGALGAEKMVVLDDELALQLNSSVVTAATDTARGSFVNNSIENQNESSEIRNVRSNGSEKNADSALATIATVGNLSIDEEKSGKDVTGDFSDEVAASAGEVRNVTSGEEDVARISSDFQSHGNQSDEEWAIQAALSSTGTSSPKVPNEELLTGTYVAAGGGAALSLPDLYMDSRTTATDDGVISADEVNSSQDNSAKMKCSLPDGYSWVINDEAKLSKSVKSGKAAASSASMSRSQSEYLPPVFPSWNPDRSGGGSWRRKANLRVYPTTNSSGIRRGLNFGGGSSSYSSLSLKEDSITSGSIGHITTNEELAEAALSAAGEAFPAYEQSLFLTSANNTTTHDSSRPTSPSLNNMQSSLEDASSNKRLAAMVTKTTRPSTPPSSIPFPMLNISYTQTPQESLVDSNINGLSGSVENVQSGLMNPVQGFRALTEANVVKRSTYKNSLQKRKSLERKDPSAPPSWESETEANALSILSYKHSPQRANSLKPIVSMSSPNITMSDGRYVPWPTNTGLHAMDTDKLDTVFRWEEKRDLLKYAAYDSSTVKMVLKHQELVKHSFEKFAENCPSRYNILKQRCGGRPLVIVGDRSNKQIIPKNKNSNK